MKVTHIAEHAVCLDELRKPANILDLGARGFEFTRYFDLRGDFVIPVDIDPNLGNERAYICRAITNYNGTCGIRRSNDAQATSMTRNLGAEIVNCGTLEALMDEFNIPYFDLIKADIEGSEYEVIMNLKKAPAKQISWEAHLHTGAYGMQEFKQMELKLISLGYKALKNDLYEQHGAGRNAWDNLWIRL